MILKRLPGSEPSADRRNSTALEGAKALTAPLKMAGQEGKTGRGSRFVP
jgi:hypothetical protein